MTVLFQCKWIVYYLRFLFIKVFLCCNALLNWLFFLRMNIMFRAVFQIDQLEGWFFLIFNNLVSILEGNQHGCCKFYLQSKCLMMCIRFPLSLSLSLSTHTHTFIYTCPRAHCSVQACCKSSWLNVCDSNIILYCLVTFLTVKRISHPQNVFYGMASWS